MGPPTRELPACRCGRGRLEFREKEVLKRSSAEARGRSSRSGEAPQRNCLASSLMGEQESGECRGAGHSEQRHVSVKCMLFAFLQKYVTGKKRIPYNFANHMFY